MIVQGHCLLTYRQDATFLLARLRTRNHVEDMMVELVQEGQQLILRHLAKLSLDIQQKLLGGLTLMSLGFESLNEMSDY